MYTNDYPGMMSGAVDNYRFVDRMQRGGDLSPYQYGLDTRSSFVFNYFNPGMRPKNFVGIRQGREYFNEEMDLSKRNPHPWNPLEQGVPILPPSSMYQMPIVQ